MEVVAMDCTEGQLMAVYTMLYLYKNKTKFVFLFGHFNYCKSFFGVFLASSL